MKFSWLLIFLVGLWQVHPNGSVENVLEHPSVTDLLDVENAEIFQVVPLHRYLVDGVNRCANPACEQTYIYDFSADATIVTIVAAGQLLDVQRIENATPAFNGRIDQMAQTLIANDPAVQEAVGGVRESADIVIMQMQHPSCLSNHLCVATTFLTDGGSVWVLVDVTQEQIVDLWWGDVTGGNQATTSEASSEAFYDCEPHHLVRGKWKLQYRITPSDGFAVADVYFDGKQVVSDIRLIQWEANYVNDGNYAYVDYAGCGAQGPGHGFPIDPVGETEINAIRGGFSLAQDFQMFAWGSFCNYRYEQIYEFYDDGRWRVIGQPYGRGCGDGRYKEATYRPIFRIDFAVNGIGNDFFQTWDGSQWQQQNVEAYFTPTALTNPEGRAFRILDENGTGFEMEMGAGQFEDAGQGDAAYTYLTVARESEGAFDMPTLGECCHQDHQKGPIEFVDEQDTAGEHLVVWYIPEALTQTKFAVDQGVVDVPYCWTESTTEYYPCPMGPMFHPIRSPELTVGLRSAEVTQINPSLVIIGIGLALLTGFYFSQIKRTDEST